MLEKINHKSAPKEVVKALVTLYHQGKFDEILKQENELINLYPDSVDLYNIFGSTNLALNQFKNAIGNFKKAIKINPNLPIIFYNLGLSFHYDKNFESALSSYEKAIKLNPDHADTYCNMGMSFNEKGDFKRAIKSYRKTLEINPDHMGAHYNLGAIYSKTGELNLAIKNYKKATSLNPKNASSYNSLGEVYYKMGNLNESIINYKKAIELQPTFWQAYNNLSLVYEEKGDIQPAIKICQKSIDIEPKNPHAYNNLGVLYFKLKNYKRALEKIQKAMNLKSNFTVAYNNIANVFHKMKDYKKALYYYEKALKDHKESSVIHSNIAIVQNLIGNHNKSIHHRKLSVKLDPNSFSYLESLLFDLNYSSDMTAEEIFEYYEQFDKKFGLPLKHKRNTFAQPKIQKNKLKIGYVSPDFKRHSVQSFLLPTLAHHNHDKFEVFAFAELDKADLITEQYKSYVDHWIRTEKIKDDELVKKIRDLGIDILVDVAGHTKNNRLKVFAQKPTPISLTWLGFGYTTGLGAIDYFLTDKVMAPKGSEHLFSEKLWQLKNHPFCCYKAQVSMNKITPLSALSNGFITFGTLTRTIRINDRVIKAWADILTKVPNSKLIINSKNFLTTSFRNFHQKDSETIIELNRKFKDHGISENRLDFYYKTPPWDSMRQIDIALDCFPHNSGTTLIEHLYMGNPFITYSNRPSVGKIGASILTSLGHPEWIATSEEEYVEKAVALASDPQKLSTIRQNLRAEMEASPLMDHKGFVRELEGAYQAMWEKWCSA